MSVASLIFQTVCCVEESIGQMMSKEINIISLIKRLIFFYRYHGVMNRCSEYVEVDKIVLMCLQRWELEGKDTNEAGVLCLPRA